MRIQLLTVTHNVPRWIQQGYEAYAKRLTHSCKLDLIEIPAEKRHGAAEIQRVLQKEGSKMMSLIKPQHFVIALDVKGESWSTEMLSAHLKRWQHQEKVVDLLVGGPEGLAEECLQRANVRWSLSALTFPHALIRILVAEQIYRASTLLSGHPYHKT